MVHNLPVRLFAIIIYTCELSTNSYLCSLILHPFHSHLTGQGLYTIHCLLVTSVSGMQVTQKTLSVSWSHWSDVSSLGWWSGVSGYQWVQLCTDTDWVSGYQWCVQILVSVSVATSTVAYRYWLGVQIPVMCTDD